MVGVELFIFTDNSTAENAFYKGSSNSRKLFELILKKRQIEINAGYKIYFIHVAGTRMIHQGTDSLSRGITHEGAMKGDEMLDFVPLRLSALERLPKLKDWIKEILMPSRGEAIDFLDHKGWFERGRDILVGEP